ncbi:very short patch repair endonuclease [Bradyrhizobium sp. CCBAU 51765]|uniref:very short patch repair endonuclease n=1 Tax=Bradyrhizobium sp. CCBAU 51765 TaxID=1325102 RepID=UPI0018881DE4|nr:very short patch repair endonuclease [Bradyrhizobium sp. CCBAU 51765]QOZ07513.1 very short patch repair endonuclease [Bradyrhizobium sp. CCBAU 51765]
MDKLDSKRRSANMRAIRAKNTKPELVVRRALRLAGFTGYRLHRRDLPGKPDIAFIGRKKAILVHGCFWHGHDCREGLRRPKARQEYWLPKISGNQMRDERHQTNLISQGWSVLVVWECETSHPALAQRLAAFVGSGSRD